MEDKIGFIYILKNKAFPDLLKIGYTFRTIEERVRELSSATGIPYAFEKAHVAETFSPDKKEKIIHKHLLKYRVTDKSKKTEFFKINLEKAIHVVNMVANPPEPPKTPEPPFPLDPPKLTQHEQDIRSKTVKDLLSKKFKHRKKVINSWWLENLEGNLRFEEEVQKRWKEKGFIKRLSEKKPKPNIQIINEYEIAIKNLIKFDQAYTFEVFLTEHETVQGVDQIIGNYPSKLLDFYMGLRIEIMDLSLNKIFDEEEYGVHDDEILGLKITKFIPTENISFKQLESDYLYHNGKPKGEHSLFEDWDRFSSGENYLSRDFSGLEMFDEKYRMKDLSEKLYSDKGRKKKWKEEWTKEWWKKADPDGISPLNPFKNVTLIANRKSTDFQNYKL